MINILSLIILNYIFFYKNDHIFKAILFSLIPNILSFQIFNIYKLYSKNQIIPYWFKLIRNILYSIFIWLIIFTSIYFLNNYNIPKWTLSVITTIIFDIFTSFFGVIVKSGV